MKVLLGASALVVALALPAQAQQPSAGNLEKLGNFQQTGTAEMAHIPQTGAKAEAIKKIAGQDQAAARLQDLRSTRSCRMRVTSRSGRKAS